MGSEMRHEARQVPAWLIFDVGQKMKRFLLIFTLVTTCYAYFPPPQSWSGQWKGEPYVTVFPTGSMSGIARWSPESGHWPMSTVKAVEVARKGLRKVVGEVEPLIRLRDVGLFREASRTDDGLGDWYFVITFGSERHEAGAVGDLMKGGLSIVSLTFVVFPDGHVVSPQKKAPNKAPEPTPGAVTPRATEGASK